MSRDFGYKDAPDTCLWCGRKLYRNQFRMRHGDETRGMFGFFDTITCAFQFAVVLARAGRRLTSTTKDGVKK